MFVIGLTGSLGTGKSTAASFFKKCGARVLDADRIAHEQLQSRGPVYESVRKTFGPGVLTKGRIDRKKLGTVVFHDPLALKKLEGIIHPAVARTIREKIGQYQKSRASGAVVIDVPLLFEAGLHRYVDTVVVVRASRAKQISRAKRRLHITKQEALRRIKAQMPLSQKIRLADFIIDNRGSLTETKKQVDIIWRELLPRTKK